MSQRIKCHKIEPTSSISLLDYSQWKRYQRTVAQRGPSSDFTGESYRRSCLFKCLQDETTTGTLNPGRVTSENSLIHNSEKGVRRELSELQRYSQGPLGVSINLYIYLKLSKFSMTNVTAPLNWSSSLGSLGGLGEVPATGTWKEINLQIPWKHRELLWETYGGSHTAWKKKASKCQHCSSDGRRVSAVHT